MEVYYRYKGYGITYYSATGTTVVDDGYGNELIAFKQMAEVIGTKNAKDYIDSEINN